MKVFKEHLIIIGFSITVFFIVLSCSSGRDIYRNPYQTTYKASFNTNENSGIQLQTSPHQYPEWIYAVSKDFIVGYGQGKDIMEARVAALNNIKAFIIKSLGETGSIIELNFVQNIIGGRNLAESQEGYLMKHHFENKFHPVINISVDRLDDYYYEKIGSYAKYYIKYKIDEEELGRIKDDFQKSLRKKEALASKIKHTVDSLTTIKDTLSIESLIERYNTIKEALEMKNLTIRDSLCLVRGIQSIKGFLNAVDIKVLKHKAGDFTIFNLYSGLTPVKSKIKPIVKSDAIIINSIIKQEDIWELKYNVKPGLAVAGVLEIAFDLPYKRVSTTLDIPPSIIKPELEIIGKVLMSDIQRNVWTGKLKNLKIRLNINSLTDNTCLINTMDIILNVNENIYPIIIVDNLNFEISKGVNHFVKTIECELPYRFFITKEMECDLRLFYNSGSSIETYELNNIQLTINNY